MKSSLVLNFKHILMCCFLLLVCSCSDKNTPSSKAIEVIEYLQDKDYDSYVDEIYLGPGKEFTQKDKDGLVELMKNKGEDRFKKNDGLKKATVEKETIAEDGNTAVVTLRITYNNGKTETQKMNLIKDENGDWKVKAK